MLHQKARQVDGVTPLDVVGEVHCRITRGHSSFLLDVLVVRQLDVDVLAGNPFMETNDVAVRLAKRQIIIGGKEVVHYGNTHTLSGPPSARRAQAFLLRISRPAVILPGESLQVSTLHHLDPDAI